MDAANHHASATDTTLTGFDAAQSRWQEEGEIPADDVQAIVLRAVSLCVASVDAARDVFAAARGPIGSTVQCCQITDAEVAARAQGLLLELQLGVSATPLMPRA